MPKQGRKGLDYTLTEGKANKKEIISYGIGDFACNGFYSIISSYLMFFYTDVANLPLASVGFIILGSRLLDAVACPGMGYLIDRTDTRWGKARPYLLWTSIPLCLMLVALFASPDASENAKVGYALGTSAIYSLLYCALSVPYSTMMTCMTRDDKERLAFNFTKNVSSNLGAFFVTSMTLFGVNLLGEGDRKKGFLFVMVFFAVLYFVLILLCFKNTHERVQSEQKRIPLGQALVITVKNRHWIILCILDFFMLMGMSMRTQGTLYYATYCLHRESLGSTLLSMSTFLAIPMVFFVTRAADRIGKTRCIVAGNLLLAVGLAGMYLAQNSIPAVLIFHVIASIGSGLASGLIFVMIAEVVDYSEYQTGVRPQGLLTSTVSLMMKLGSACAGAISAKVLEMGGYVAGNVQSAPALRSITVNYLGFPFVLAIVCLFVIRFYTLDKEYGRVKQKLSGNK